MRVERCNGIPDEEEACDQYHRSRQTLTELAKSVSVLDHKQTVQVAAFTVDVLQVCMMSSSQLLAVFLAAICINSVSAQDQVVKVSLDKRTLSADELAPQKRAEQLGLLQSSNGGEDIPILNFLDAQVTLAKRPLCLALGKLLPQICKLSGQAAVLRADWPWQSSSGVHGRLRHWQLQPVGAIVSV